MFIANEPEASSSGDLKDCSSSVEVKVSSAIDAFEEQQRWITMRAFRFQNDNFELNMLIMALTSATENYFRTVIASIVTNCPICLSHNIDGGKISLRAISYYPPQMLTLAFMEHVSFSDTAAVRKQVSDLLKFQIPETDKGSSSISSAMQQFDKVCALRHALIHSSGLLNSKNCVEAGLQNGFKSVSTSIQGLQVAIDICRNVVLAFNQFLFSQIVSRLYQKSYLTGNFEVDAVIIDPIIKIFVSERSPNYSPDIAEMRRAIHASYESKVEVVAVLKVN